MRHLFLYQIRSAIAGRVMILTLLVASGMVWHFGLKCHLLFNDAGIAIGAWEYGAEKPCREFTETLSFSGLVIFLLMIGATSHLTPNVFRRGFLDLLHARPVGRPMMLASAFIVQWGVMAGSVGVVYLAIGFLWGGFRGTWTPWLPELAGAFTVEAAGIAALMLFFGVVTRRPALTTVLTVFVGLALPAFLDKVIGATEPGSLLRDCGRACFAVIPQTLFASQAVAQGMTGQSASYEALGQIPIASAFWVFLSNFIFMKKDY
jgi:hypothetical protein